MKIMKLISNCGECEYLYSTGYEEYSVLYCGKEMIYEIPENGIPDWCPLEDYEVKK